MKRCIIGVLTAEKYDARREAVRFTWGNTAANNPRCDLVFLIGDSSLSEAKRIGDILYLPCHDNYDSLPQKTRQFCRWALEAGGEWDYLFKCDDDTYVHVPRLLDGIWPAPVVGGKHTDDNHFHGGAGYTITRPAAEAIAKYLTAATGLEDWKARDAIHKANLRFALDPRLCWNKERMPSPSNNCVTAHYVSPVRMRLIHDELRIAGEYQLLNTPIPTLFHHVWLDGEPPAYFKSNRATWRDKHPGAMGMLHTRETLDWLTNQRLFAAAPTAAQACQIARYEILHRFGGVYVDYDVECRRAITPLTTGTQGFAAAEDDETIGIAVMGCAPNDPLMASCVAALAKECRFAGNPPAESGSRFFTSHFLADTAWRLYWWREFYPRHWDGRIVAPAEGAFAVHHWAGSWKAHKCQDASR